jgi:hypothetical protein
MSAEERLPRRIRAALGCRLDAVILENRRRRAGRPDVTHGRRAPSAVRGQSIGVLREVSVF